MSETARVATFSAASLARKLDLGGTFRACDPAETFARLRPILPKVGITRVADVTGLDRIGIPVAMSVPALDRFRYRGTRKSEMADLGEGPLKFTKGGSHESRKSKREKQG